MSHLLQVRLLLYLLAFASNAATALQESRNNSNSNNNMLNLLMVGNSFTDANGLEEMVQALLEETAGATTPVYALRFQHGGAKFVEHAADMSLQAMMAERKWTWVVLQEQSEIPGFWNTDFEHEYVDSMQAASTLNQWIITKAHAETVLLMTWARRHEDPYNPTIFPDFPTMQERVATGYYNMQTELSTPDRQVHIAPAGLAFQTVYNQVLQQADDVDPAADGTAFSNLYAQDGIHPSPAGSYLVACVIYATLTGRTDLLPLLQYAPPAVSAKLRNQLQRAAAITVEQFNQEHSWNRPNDAAKKKTNDDDSSSSSSNRPYVPRSSSSQSKKDDNNTASTGVIPLMIVVLATGLAFSLVILRRHHHNHQLTSIATSDATAYGGDEFSFDTQVELAHLDNNNKHNGGGMYGEGSVL